MSAQRPGPGLRAVARRTTAGIIALVVSTLVRDGCPHAWVNSGTFIRLLRDADFADQRGISQRLKTAYRVTGRAVGAGSRVTTGISTPCSWGGVLIPGHHPPNQPGSARLPVAGNLC